MCKMIVRSFAAVPGRENDILEGANDVKDHTRVFVNEIVTSQKVGSAEGLVLVKMEVDTRKHCFQNGGLLLSSPGGKSVPKRLTMSTDLLVETKYLNVRYGQRMVLLPFKIVSLF